MPVKKSLAPLLIVFAILPGADVRQARSRNTGGPDDFAAALAGAASACREVAGTLREKATACRSYLASHPDGECNVKYPAADGAIKRFSPGEAEALAASFEETAAKFERAHGLRARVVGDQEAIRRAGFEITAEVFEDLEKLSTEQKAELEKKTLDALISSALLGANKVVAAVEKLTPSEARRWIGKLRKAGVTDRRLYDAIKRLSRARGRAEQARAWQEVLEGVGRTKDAAFVSVPGETDWREKAYAAADAFATILSWAIKDPRLSLLVTEAQFLVSYVFVTTPAWVLSEARVEQLTALNEAKLKDLKILSRRLQDDVAALKVALNDLPRPCELN